MGEVYGRLCQVVLGLTAALFLVSLLNFIPAIRGYAPVQTGVWYVSAVLLGLSVVVVLPMVVVRHPYPEVWLSAAAGFITATMGLTDGLDKLAVIGLVLVSLVIVIWALLAVWGAWARLAQARGWRWPAWAGSGLAAVFFLLRLACGLVCLGFGLTSLYFAVLLFREGDLGAFFLLLLTGVFFSLVGLLLLAPLIRRLRRAGFGGGPEGREPPEGDGV
jgi:hypothetical protein